MSRRSWDEAHRREQEAKSAVRARDNYQCRDCGMKEQDHVDQTGKGLEVHRLFPGSAYEPNLCITLCRSCHGKKPKSIDALWFHHAPEESGVLMVAWIVASPIGKAMYATLKEIADVRKISVDSLIDEIVDRYIRDLPMDYCI